jgi:uncharacterized membrane protein
MNALQRAPVIAPGLGGFVDGIVFHQILQWHGMLSSRIPPDTVAAIKVNMVWDGWFHAAVWLMTVFGLTWLWRSARRADVAWSGRSLVGALLCGWGLFNLIEGVINHHLLGLHHVHEYLEQPLILDVTLLVSGGCLC